MKILNIQISNKNLKVMVWIQVISVQIISLHLSVVTTVATIVVGTLKTRVTVHKIQKILVDWMKNLLKGRSSTVNNQNYLIFSFETTAIIQILLLTKMIMDYLIIIRKMTAQIIINILTEIKMVHVFQVPLQLHWSIIN